MAASGELERIAPESLMADWSTPAGQRLAKRDMERLYRLFALGVDRKYLADATQDDLSGVEDVVALDPEESEDTIPLDPEESEDTIPLDPEESEDSVDLQQEVIPVSGGGTGTTAASGATTDIKAALAAHGILTDGGAAPLDLDNGLFTSGSNTIHGAASTAIFSPFLSCSGNMIFGLAQLVISSGRISAANAQTHWTVDTEASAATDDLDGTSTTPNVQRLLFISAQNDARTVVIKHNVAAVAPARRFMLGSALDFSLDTVDKCIGVYYDNVLGYWKEIFRSAG